MTLVITMFAPGGIYQSSDNRLSTENVPTDHEAVKHLAVVCPDGGALFSFVGLAHTPDGVHIIEWMRRAVCGPTRTIDEVCDAIGQKAVADIGHSRYRSHGLTIIAASSTTSGTQYSQIANTWTERPTGNSVVREDFFRKIIDVDGSRIFAQGAGAGFLSGSDKDLLRYCCARTPRDPEDYLRLLAAVNRRVALRAKRANDHSVGESCYTAFMPRQVWPIRGRSWQNTVPLISREMRPVPVVVGGSDVTPRIWSFAESARARGTLAGMRFIFGPEASLDGPDPDAKRRTRRSRRRYARGQ